MEKNYIWVALAVVVILIGGYFLYAGNAQAPTVEEGAPSGGTFSYINASSDLIVVDSPKPGQTVGQVISVSGSARG